jgi:lincosamide nucleotidyltransferase A/C/D/E
MINVDYNKRMDSKTVIKIYQWLESAGIQIWIDGGWGVDSLLGRQTRPHKDLDIAVQWKDVPLLREFLAAKAYKQIKEDNKWNFVLADPGNNELDVHAFIYDDKGNVVDGIMYPAESLTGTGSIDGRAIKCISARYMVEFLTPWMAKYPDKYLQAVSNLCKKFNIPFPGQD